MAYLTDPAKNFAKVTVDTGYDASDTTIVLSSGHGARLPAPATDGAFNLVWWNSTDYSDPTDDPNVEIVRCTARSTDTLTVTRAQESTSASTKNTGSRTYKMVLGVTNKMIQDISDLFAARANINLSNIENVAISAALLLGTSDAFALGSATKMWSDLFLASGAVINFNAGDVTVTHSANALAFAGGTVSFDTAPTIGGGAVYYSAGTDVALADGGTGASLADPNADRIMFWDDSLGAVTWLTPGTGLSISGTTINATVGGLTWSEVTGTTQAASVNNAYIVNNAGLVTVTIPDTAALGDTLKIVGKGAGGWKIAQNASENIRFGNAVTTTGTGGSLASTNQYDCIELVCTVANTTWTVTSSIGNITYV